MITLRPDQDRAVSDLRRELSKNQSVLLHAECGWGKCLGFNTPILMFDGSIKVVQDVIVGDLLIGPDSQPRKVLSLARGRENLWRVHQRKGEDYTVNESHILSFMKPRKDGVREILNISVSEYLNQGFGFINLAKGWKSSADFLPGKSPILDPYMLGVWLGDGTSRTFSITTGDEEIKSYIFKFAENGGLRVRVEPNSTNSEVLHVVSDRNKNWAMAALHSYDLVLNKHVPSDYKRASRKDRLALLAGFLDADGHCNKNGGFDVSQKSEKLIDDIIFVAKSLGFSANKKIRDKTCCNNGKTASYFHFSLNGPLNTIPCRVARKRGAARRQVKNHLVTGIALEPLGVGDYYGFEIDGDRLFLLGDFTVTHNTVVAAFMAQNATHKNRRVIFGVHRRELARQTAKTFEKFGIRYGFIAAGMRADPFAYAQIASAATLKNRPNLIGCDLFVPDEAHLWANGARAELISEARQSGAHIVPLTATPGQGNGRGLAHIADAMVHGPTAAWLIERGHLAKWKAYAPVSPDLSRLKTRGGEYAADDVEEEFGKPQVIGDRVAAYLKYARGKRMIGFAYSRKNGEETALEFRRRGVSAVFIDGETPDNIRIAVIAKFADREIDVLINCALFQEGFDLSAQVGRDVPIEAVGLWTPTRSLPRAHQMLMRPLRPQSGHAIIIDHVNLLHNHGFPDDEHEWNLQGHGKMVEGATPMVKCPTCFWAGKPCAKCPDCGHEFKGEDVLSPGRQVEEVAGDIEEIDVEAVRRARKYSEKQELYAAQSMVELAGLAKKYGRKPGWVKHVMIARGKPSPTIWEIERAMRG